MTKQIDLEIAAQEISNQLVYEILKVFEKEDVAGFGSKFVKNLQSTFLSTYTATIAMQEIESQKRSSKDKKIVFTNVTRGFIDLKERISDAIASGLEDAMSRYAGKPVEYYCQIHAVQDNLSKKVC